MKVLWINGGLHAEPKIIQGSRQASPGALEVR